MCAGCDAHGLIRRNLGKRKGNTETSNPRCQYCFTKLLFVHGHYQCPNDQCWCYGMNVIPCCDGEERIGF